MKEYLIDRLICKTELVATLKFYLLYFNYLIIFLGCKKTHYLQKKGKFLGNF